MLVYEILQEQQPAVLEKILRLYVCGLIDVYGRADVYIPVNIEPTEELARIMQEPPRAGRGS